ncbi:MAG: crotonase, partial [Ignavibacteria bacterium]
MLKHWKIDTDAEGICWATLDKADSSTNVLSAEVMAELGQVLDACDKAPPKALIFRSGKEAGFIAGADIEE